jgi:hypothetical protein
MSETSKLTVDAPEITPATGGILGSTHVSVQNTPGYALYYGVQYVPTLEGHNRPVPEDGVEKVFDKIEGLTESVPFTTYRGVDVSLMRFHGQAKSLVEAAYTGSESYGVEAALQEKLLEDAVVLGGGVVTDPRLALGLLQQYARDNFSGQPLITGNALALTLVEDALEGEGSDLTTKLGVPVALAGGYGANGPGAAVAAAGQAWIYITGQINIWRGPVEVTEAPGLRNNRELGLAEAQYAASIDGPVAAILVGT